MTTAADRAAFEATIAENPDDPTPRVIFADFLDESGLADEACEQRLAVAMNKIISTPEDDGLRLEWADIAEGYGRRERAEFVRVQVELWRLTIEDDPHTGSGNLRDWYCESPFCKACGLRRQECELLNGKTGNDGWIDFGKQAVPILRLTQPYQEVFVFHRGFISTVSLTMQQVREHLPTIYREHPVERVGVTDREPGEGGKCWRRGRDQHPIRDPQYLPWRIFDLLPNSKPPAEFSWFKDRDAAMLALSRAVLEWAKGER